MTNKAYVGAIIADIHWGTLNAKSLFAQLKNNVIDKLMDLPILDFIIINGDYFDTKISLNSEHAKLSLDFMYDILELSNKKNAKVRLIKGTESHDNKQLEILNIFTINQRYNFKIISTVESEYLFDDLKVLYIPEEYVEDKNKYYENYFKETDYDMVFGHGLINEVAFVASKQESEITMSKAPVFKSNQLFNICKGPIFFGHIHTPQCIKERFFYSGSFSRWCFGEEETKGYYLVSYSPDNTKFLTEFIENNEAPLYDTINIDIGVNDKSDTENVEYIISFVKSIVYQHLRLIINIPEDYPNPVLLTNMINEVFSKYTNLKVVINNNRKLLKKQETDKKINLLLERYGIIFDKTKSYEEKITEFIKIKYNKNISIERIREYLYQKIIEEVS